MNRNEQDHIRDTVERAYRLTAEDLDWRPYYPNNMPQNGQEGWYCIIQGPDGENARKYTICFQYDEDEDGMICEDEDGMTRTVRPIDRFILFEKCYVDKGARLEYPEPSETCGLENDELGVNDFGCFVYAHKTLEQAKRRALRQYQMVFGYAMSHLIEEEELP